VTQKYIQNSIYNNYSIVLPPFERLRTKSIDGISYPSREANKKGIKEYKKKQKKKLGASFFHAAKVIGGGVEELAKEGESWDYIIQLDLLRKTHMFILKAKKIDQD
jgi:hypothetical protein